MDIYKIMEILPQRYPMLMVDEVLELQEGEYAKGIKAVSVNEPYFQGHFPEKPVMPGIFIIEACMQMIHIMMLSKPEDKDKKVYYSEISKANYYDVVLPGSILSISVTKKIQEGQLAICGAEVKVGEKVIFKAKITIVITE